VSVDIQPRADGDLEVAGDELDRWQPGTAARFVAQLNDALARLEQLPRLAGKYEPESPDFPDLRVYPIPRDFGYLVFYQPTADGISVVRVLHRSRNLPAIFG
jgi:plasmid stabilization system protein ParE